MEITRRNLLIGSGAVVAAGVAGYALWRNSTGSVLPQTSSAPVQSAGDLLKPGPLGDMILGSETAPVTVVEYASLTCPHCREFAVHTFPEVKKRYIDTGKVRFIFREFVLNNVDFLAVVTARCAPKEKYFPLVETLYEKQDNWAVDDPRAPLLAIARQAGFTAESFQACAANQTVIDGVGVQRDAGSKFGVKSTPTFFINGKMTVGAMSIEEFEKQLQPYLKG